MPSPEKFRKTLTEFAVDESVIQAIYQGFGELTSKTNKKIKSAFFKQALEVMNAELPPARVQEIIEANACCKSGIREKSAKDFARLYKELPLEERLRKIRERPDMYMGWAERSEDGFLVVHAVSCRSEGSYVCVCPTVSKIKRDYAIPREYCYCCGGHFKYHYEIMLDVKLALCEIVSSPHDTNGQEPCVFKYRILPPD